MKLFIRCHRGTDIAQCALATEHGLHSHVEVEEIPSRANECANMTGVEMYSTRFGHSNETCYK